ncbi:hypothetical protein Poli38472_013744 [Pythium oligandrum]|uniref:CASTOR ACT domain-containing protein n=1 Tax=Pythium oligandrum TaxID=41045 RepID=A0A8K1CDA2_PYTOL|nr:hypothetical protein Poli38472_013744 [Pythium oligandrum]|eukprot:TMW61281.1 hypothetical protein Poli38472_013744 [Pythium oligandrum]
MAATTPRSDAPVQLVCMKPSLVITSIKKKATQHLFRPLLWAEHAESTSNASRNHSGSSHLTLWLLELLFFSATDEEDVTSSRFVSYVETEHELSIVMDEAMLPRFPEGTLAHEPSRWKALQVASAGAGAFLTQLETLHELTTLLANQHISVFRVSTYQTDYILIKVEDLHRAVQCLESMCDVEMDEDEMAQFEMSRTVEIVCSEQTSPCGDQANQSSTQELTISTPHMKLYVLQIDKACMKRHLYSLLRMFFNECRSPRTQSAPASSDQLFLSYSEAGGNISIVTSDVEFLQSMRELADAGEVGIMVCPDAWKVVQVSDHDLGFTEADIVAAHTRVLLSAGTTMFFLSTYTTEYMLIKEDEWSDAMETLQEHLRFVDGHFVPLVQPATNVVKAPNKS